MSDSLLTPPALQIVHIALSRPEHADALLQLLDHYAADPMGGATPLPREVRNRLIGALQERRDYVGFLAFLEGTPVGLANCFEGFSTFVARPLLNLHDLVVHTEARGRGIAQALLSAVEREARARGCCKVTLEVLSGNTRAQKSYTHFGFRSYALDAATGTAIYLEKNLA